jgi:hypothetical protein
LSSADREFVILEDGGMYLTQVATTCSGLGYGGLSQIVVGV